LIPLVSKEAKTSKDERVIFKLFSRGVATQRDEWVYDFSKSELEQKIKFFVGEYSKSLNDKEYKDKNSIKWDRELTKYLKKEIKITFSKRKIIDCAYRPFAHQHFYFDEHLNGMTYQWFNILNLEDKENRFIAFNSPSNPKGLFALVSSRIVDLHFTGDSQCLPLYRYDEQGNRHDNITDWGLEQFQTHYKTKKITKEDIFFYTYAVLHNPAYRTKYELNLKREFPRLPFYENFKQWKEWGKELMDLHINYEQAKPFALKEINSNTKVEHKKTKEFFTKAEEPEPIYSFRGHAKVKLKAIKETGIIEIDEYTMLTGIPPEAWE
jgi:predicted helicase